MSKGRNFTGQPVFTQLLSFLDRSRVARLSHQHRSDRYYKRFKTYQHLVTMLYAIYHKCTSLREVTTGMQACMYKLNHLGLDYCPRRSTLSDANRTRSSKVFEAIYLALFERYRRILPDSRSGKPKWHSRLYIIDSTTITLFKEILSNAGRRAIDGKKKGGIKVHTLMKAAEDVPCLIQMTAASKHDTPFIKGLQLPEGSFVTFDKGYLDYRQFDLWTEQNVFWVTRLKQSAAVEYTSQRPFSKTQQNKGIRQDSQVVLGHTSHKGVHRINARLIQYYDRKTDREFRFITNNFTLAPATIALIYKHRWQIELLFKRIKQNYPLRYFLGDNENAIRTQIWCALIADLILKVIQARVNRKWSFGNLSSMVRIHLMSYTNLIKFLESPDKYLINTIHTQVRGPTLFQ